MAALEASLAEVRSERGARDAGNGRRRRRAPSARTARRPRSRRPSARRRRPRPSARRPRRRPSPRPPRSRPQEAPGGQAGAVGQALRPLVPACCGRILGRFSRVPTARRTATMQPEPARYGAAGLYDPATSTTPAASPSWPSSREAPTHGVVERALVRAREPRAPRRRGRRSEHRRRRGDPAPAARRVLPRRARASSCRRRAATASAMLLPPARRRRRRAELERADRATRSSPRASACWAGATSRSTSATSAETAPRSAPVIRQLVIGAGEERGRPGRVRAQALRDPPRGRAGGRRRPRDPEPLLAHDRLQGDADRAAAAGLLPGPARRADRRRGSRSCTRASRRTRSRAGSWRTRTG